MKKLLLLAGLLSINVFAQLQTHTIKSIQVRTCHEEMMGCAPKIILNGQSILIDQMTLTEELSKKITKANGATIQLENIEGFIVKETGHFPNPTVEFEVFKFVINDADATLNTCNFDLMGCATSITVKGERTVVDLEKVPFELYARDGEEVSVTVKGYYSYEKDHMPNPMVEQKVFKIITIKENDIIDLNDFRKIDGTKLNLRNEFRLDGISPEFINTRVIGQ